jgi:hypothetical protein
MGPYLTSQELLIVGLGLGSSQGEGLINRVLAKPLSAKL